MTLRLTRRESLILLTAASLGSAAHAQSYPSKPITMVVPYPPGGGTDAVARLIAEKIGKKLGQNVVVDNRAGASGLIGVDKVAKSVPDGYTILVALSTQFVINPYLFKKLPYDPNKDIALVSQIVASPIALLVHPSVPATDVPSMMKYITAKKGKLAYGSYGIGSASHLSGAHLSQITGGDMNHVAYKGEAPMIQDLIGGQMPMGFGSAVQAKSMIDAGKLKAIAVTGEKRLPLLPNVPTFVEQGVKDDVFRTVGFIAMAVPGATPKPIIQRLAAEVKAACELPEVRERIAGFGFEAAPLGPDEFTAKAKADAQVWARLVKQTGATLD
ncbi:Bug family tripartite tricarboxylate transporter substrate binding protein [Ottowia sp.]|uniref:Bug family tripartite tricarboxylate transporter substrate binding protein n=1 Tax=Ottowia sp. TaxID=1898956 RepID=UPI0039423E9E